MSSYHVSSITIYPIKSLRGISLAKSEVDQFGFKYDRRWMLIDEKNKFVTQREIASMCLIDVAISDESLLINVPQQKTLKVDFDCFQTDSIKVTVWSDICSAHIASAEVNAWFSAFLQCPIRLVFMDDQEVRVVDQQFAGSSKDQVGFADGFPFLLLSQASLNDLNDKLLAKNEAIVTMERFRPNIVIDNALAFEEDNWQKIKIGAFEFDVAKPCSRCVIPTIDTQNAVKSKEPLATLRQYRQQADMKIYFGQNLIHSNEPSLALAKLKVGDRLKVVTKK